jgi:hypothetical protein
MVRGNGVACCAVAAAALAVLGLSAGAWAGPVLTIEPFAASYSPGGSVDFDVRLADAANLASYNVKILIQDTGGLPGGLSNNNYWLADLLPLPADDANIATRPANSNYVFGLNIDPTPRITNTVGNGGSSYGINLSDYDDAFAGRSTDPGQQVLGTFRVQTGAAFHGTLRLTFDTLELDAPSSDPEHPESIAGFDPGDYNSYSVTLTPEPATAGLLVTGLAGWLVSVRRRRAGAGAAA